MIDTALKIGILGGGQLGRMLQEVGQRWNLNMHCMDTNVESPAGIYREFFTCGNIKNYDDVVKFGLDKDIITIEIEHVNLEALYYLKSLGKKIHPNPDALFIIQNKNRQKDFYHQLGLYCPQYITFQDRTEAIEIAKDSKWEYPFIYKSAEMGYDGKGVKTIEKYEDIFEIPDAQGAFETLIDIDKEVAVMVCRNEDGHTAVYDPVLMDFDRKGHVLSTVIYPTNISEEKTDILKEWATKIINELNICGLLAVEFFIDKNGKIWLNEVAPRPHNSMHLTMDCAETSQFEQHLRGICNFPLGSSEFLGPCGMYNLLGESNDQGVPHWTGWENVFSNQGIHVHLYGKKEIKPGRKMGHINIRDIAPEVVNYKINLVKDTFKHQNHAE